MERRGGPALSGAEACGAERWACRAGLDRIGSHWPSDVLEFFLSEIDELFLEAVTHLPIGVLGKTDAARISNAFKTRGDVDAVAHQVAVALLDHIAEMDADPELDATLGRQASVALDHAVLHLDGAADGIDHAAELDEDAVAGPLDDAAVMQGDGRVDQIAAERPQPRKRPLLVGTGKLAVSGYIRRKNGCEFPGLRHGSPFTTRQTSANAGRSRQVVSPSRSLLASEGLGRHHGYRGLAAQPGPIASDAIK